MTRDIKSVSFSRQDEYEADLLNFALSESKYFGRYVKRLIADHRERVRVGDGGLKVVSPVKASQDYKDERAESSPKGFEQTPAVTPERLEAPTKDDTHHIDINDFI